MARSASRYTRRQFEGIDYLVPNRVTRLSGNTGWAAVRNWLTTHWTLMAAVAVALALTASDFDPASSAFWRSHQILVSFLTGGALALIALLGLDRVLGARDAKVWQPIGLMLIKRLDTGIFLDEALSARVLDYCGRTYGDIEVPEGRSYFDILPEALQDPRTWESSDPEVPDLLTEVEEATKRAEEEIKEWAPLLIADRQLARIGKTAVELMDAAHYVYVTLTYADAWGAARVNRWAPGSSDRGALVGAVVEHRRVQAEFRSLAAEYGAPQPGTFAAEDEF